MNLCKILQRFLNKNADFCWFVLLLQSYALLTFSRWSSLRVCISCNAFKMLKTRFFAKFRFDSAENEAANFIF